MRVSVRIVGAALVAVLVGFAAAAALVRVTVWRNQTAAAAALRSSITEQDVARCEQDVATWSFDLAFGARAFAYDTSWAARNEAAPRLPLQPEHVPAEVGATLRLPRAADRGPVVAVRVREAGPCAVIAAHFNAPAQQRDPTLPSLFALALATSTMGALGFLAVARPFLRRVEELRLAAERVGEDDYAFAAPRREAEDELGRIRRSLDGAHQRIIGANEALRHRLRGLEEHLADIAHDVRTPLASLQAQIEEALDSNEAAVARPRLRGALEDCVYLAGLTENLRFAIRLEEGFEPTEATADLTAAVGRVVTRLGYLARRRGLALEHSLPDESLVVRCDPIALEQAIGNVVENAVLNLREGNRIGVVLDRAEEGFVLSIVDDGPGVARHDIARLGVRTFRTDAARARDPRGSGLGLAITRAICEKAGFRLDFASRDAAQDETHGFEVTIRGSLEEGANGEQEHRDGGKCQAPA